MKKVLIGLVKKNKDVIIVAGAINKNKELKDELMSRQGQ